MSFILDALKKSENERQRQAGPGFATIPESAGARRRRIWPIVVIALLAINLVIIGAVLMRQKPAGAPVGTSTQTASVSQQRATAQPRPARGTEPAPPRPAAMPPTVPGDARQSGTPAMPPAAPGGERDREVRSLAEEAAPERTPAPPAAGAVAADDTVATRTGSEPARAAAAPARSTTARASGSPAPPAETLPTANDLRVEGFLTGPPLHLDLHVYYPDPQRRVVFISGAKYREGDTVKGGAVVREIVPEGVVLEERGRRYVLMPD